MEPLLQDKKPLKNKSLEVKVDIEEKDFNFTDNDSVSSEDLEKNQVPVEEVSVDKVDDKSNGQVAISNDSNGKSNDDEDTSSSQPSSSRGCIIR